MPPAKKDASSKPAKAAAEKKVAAPKEAGAPKKAAAPKKPAAPKKVAPKQPAVDLENRLYLDLKDGRVTIDMRPDLAPVHVARIKELVRENFYNGIVFHRVIEGFMAQTGCPQGNGTSGTGKKLKAEFNDAPHTRGVCSMARTPNPDSADSQWFICFGDAAFLDKQYTVWGKVVDGIEHIDSIKKGAPGSGAVQNPDKIIKMSVAADVA
jgi:peptidylprolyl isomerase